MHGSMMLNIQDAESQVNLGTYSKNSHSTPTLLRLSTSNSFKVVKDSSELFFALFTSFIFYLSPQ